MNVWVLTITHKHGDNKTVHLSAKAADDELRSYVTEWWGQEFGDDEPMPEDGAIDDYFEKMEGREGYEIDETVLGEIIRDEDARVTYESWTNGYAMGFKCSRVGQPDEYIYLNPSDGSDDGVPNVFVYIGPYGDPAEDDVPAHHYVIGESWG